MHRMEQAVAETRSMAQTLGQSFSRMVEWQSDFRDRWLWLLEEAGSALKEKDSSRIAGVRLGLNDLTHDLSDDSLPTLHWPEYGALMTNLRNIVTAMDKVAAAEPKSQAYGGRLPTFRE